MSSSAFDTIEIVPRVMVDNLSDYLGLGVSGGTAYSGSSQHIARALRSARTLGIQAGVETAWRVDVHHAGPAGKWAFANRLGLTQRTKLALFSGRMGAGYYFSFPQQLALLLEGFDREVQSGEIPEKILVDVADDEVISWLEELANAQPR